MEAVVPAAAEDQLPSLDLPRRRPRVIPVLLLKGGALYKPIRFKSPKYVGDPRVAVKIFNDKGADELVLLDMGVGIERREPDYALIAEIASESFMPVAYGGGIRSFDQAKRLLELGLEKIVLSSSLVDAPDLSSKIAAVYGAQSVIGCLDCRKGLFGGYRVYVHAGHTKTRFSPDLLAQGLVDRGVGEIIVQSIDGEGTQRGYDLELIRQVSGAVRVPVIALGGAGQVEHFRQAHDAGAAAVGAGSMFVFNGPHRAVLITYPSDEKLRAVFG